MTAEIRIPISPEPHFLRQVRYLAESVRRFGGDLAASSIVVTVGGPAAYDLAAAEPWSDDLGVEWRWVDAGRFAAHGIFATALERFRYEPRADLVLFVDADVLVVDPPDFASLGLSQNGGVAGVIAYASPFAEHRRELRSSNRPTWRRLYRAAGLGEPQFICRHTGDLGHDRRKWWCPPYFNLGVLAAAAEDASRIGSVIYDELEIVSPFDRIRFRCQLALAVAVARLGIRWDLLPMRLNFPNDPYFAGAYPEEFRAARLVHYLRPMPELDRERDFASRAAEERMLARQMLNPANQLLQKRFRQIHATLAD